MGPVCVTPNVALLLCVRAGWGKVSSTLLKVPPVCQLDAPWIFFFYLLLQSCSSTSTLSHRLGKQEGSKEGRPLVVIVRLQVAQ